MFRATNKTTGEDIIILDEIWEQKVEYLRSLDKENVIVCPGCQQPVRVRAGKFRRWHFAHKHLQNCPYGYESPALLNARAVLYKWLVTKFGEKVSIEKKLGDEYLPRHVDCLVETEKGILAYWIIESGMKPAKRDDLQTGFRKLNVQVNWVFVIDMLREDEASSDSIHLTTTERVFARQTDYDEVRIGDFFIKGESLHYLDPENETMVTYRRLRLIHSPQLYQGQKIQNPIISVLVSPTSGEFVHPGEYEHFEAQRQEKLQLEKEMRERELERQRREEEARLRFSRNIPAPVSKEIPLSQFQIGYQPKNERNDISQHSVVPFRQREGTCKFCGRFTSDWVTFFGKTNECICRNCKDKVKIDFDET